MIASQTMILYSTHVLKTINLHRFNSAAYWGRFKPVFLRAFTGISLPRIARHLTASFLQCRYSALELSKD